MYRDRLVSLLKSVVLLDIVEVVSPDDNGSFHLLALHDPRQDPPPNAHVPSKRTFLVYVCTFSGLGRTDDMNESVRSNMRLATISGGLVVVWDMDF